MKTKNTISTGAWSDVRADLSTIMPRISEIERKIEAKSLQINCLTWDDVLLLMNKKNLRSVFSLSTIIIRHLFRYYFCPFPSFILGYSTAVTWQTKSEQISFVKAAKW